MSSGVLGSKEFAAHLCCSLRMALGYSALHVLKVGAHRASIPSLYVTMRASLLSCLFKLVHCDV